MFNRPAPPVYQSSPAAEPQILLLSTGHAVINTGDSSEVLGKTTVVFLSKEKAHVGCLVSSNKPTDQPKKD